MAITGLAFLLWNFCFQIPQLTFLSVKQDPPSTISYSADKLPLRTVLLDIAGLAQKNIVFDDSLVSGFTTTLSVYDQSPEWIIYHALKNTKLTAVFGFDKRTIVITPKNHLSTGKFIARIFSQQTNELLLHATIFIPDLSIGGTGNDQGEIILQKLPVGLYLVNIHHLGYKPLQALISIRQSNERPYHFHLSEYDVELAEVLVIEPMDERSQKDFAFDPFSRYKSLNRLNYFQDIFRTVQSIPGIQGNDVSSAFQVRGGHPNETLIRLDNFELIAPFHFDNFFQVSNLIPDALIDQAVIYRGGFSAQYGNKLSGTFDLNTRKPKPTEKEKWQLSYNPLNKSFYWQNSGTQSGLTLHYRQGNLGQIYKKVLDSDDLEPDYQDFFGKFNYTINQYHQFAIHFLGGTDAYEAKRGNKLWTPNIQSEQKKFASWINYTGIVSSNWMTQSTVGFQSAKWDTKFDFYNSFFSDNLDARSVDQISVSSDIFYVPNPREIWTGGVHLQSQNQTIKFEEQRYGDNQFILENININYHEPQDVLAKYYIQYERQLWTNVLISGGINLMTLSSSTETAIDPRLSATMFLSDKSTLKVAAGKYSQYESIYDMDFVSGKILPGFLKSSYQYYVEYNILFPDLLLFNASIYYKDYYQMVDDPSYSLQNRYSIFNPIPIPFSMNQAYASGVDILLKQDSDIFDWAASYSYNVSRFTDGKKDVVRQYDQQRRVELTIGINYPKNWTFDLNWKLLSGEPYTEQYDPILINDGSFKGFFVNYRGRNAKRTETVQYIKMKLARTFEFPGFSIKTYGGFYNVLAFKQNFIKHTIPQNNVTLNIPINKQIIIPQLIFFGIEINSL